MTTPSLDEAEAEVEEAKAEAEKAVVRLKEAEYGNNVLQTN